MVQGKQAKVITPHQERAVLELLNHTRNAARDRAMCLLSLKAGLQVKEIVALTWNMITKAPVKPRPSGRGYKGVGPKGQEWS